MTSQAEEELDAAAMAKKLANPTAAVSGLSNNFNFTMFDGDLPGASDQTGWSYLLQPGFPFPQGNGKNILFRPAVPVFFQQPVYDGVGDGWTNEFALGDISFDLAYGRDFFSRFSKC